MSMEFNVVEWNLNGKTGAGKKGGRYEYFFPVELITQSIDKIGCPKIVVFTEFVSAYYSSEDENTFNKAMNKLGYVMFKTEAYEGRNGVCIAVKNGNEKTQLKVVCEGCEKLSSPDYLAVGINELVVFGARLTGKSKNPQIKELLSKMSKCANEGKKVIAIGDFNKSYNELVNNREIKKHNRKFCVDGEKNNNVNNNDRCCSVLDHVITSPDVSVDEVEYNWDYMIDLFKSVKNKATYINMRSIPDHAMLKVKISIN